MVETEEPIVWCKTSCGNNLHKECQDKWAAATGRSSDVRCVYWYILILFIFQPPPLSLCLISQQRTNPIYPLSRAVWENDTPNLSPESLRSLRDDVDNLNTEGYVNLASQFGLSGKRGMGPLYLRPLFLQRLPLDTTTDYTIPVDLSVYSPFSTARPSSYWRFGNRRVRE